MQKELSEKDFYNIKKQILNGPDESKKGSWDVAVRIITDCLNKEKDYVTTSSCSGRIVLISANLDNQKNECETWYQSHEFVEEDKLADAIKIASGFLYFKFESFVLHVQCRTLEAAKKLYDLARVAGYKDSGIVIGKHGKIHLAVRSRNNLEVPLSDGEKLIVTESYMNYCVKIANEKMSRNLEQIKKFENAISSAYGSQKT